MREGRPNRCRTGVAVAALVGVVESVMARLRMPLVPHVLTAAGVIAAFGFILLVVVP
jgi:formate hydrogenlyase subunit 4